MEPRNRYILLRDQIGRIRERSTSTPGLAAISRHVCVSKGELLEVLPKNEQPGDTTRIALTGIDPKLRLECRKVDVTELAVQEDDLLLAISSPTLRLEIFHGRKRLDFGKRLELESGVLVSVRGVSNKLPGVVRYKGKVPDLPGTMFGVELHQNPGLGTCDGTFGNKRYFKCAPNSAVFVGLDELEPLEDNSKSRLDSGKHDPKLQQPRNIDNLKIDQRVVTFGDKDLPLRGTVRYIGDTENSRGCVQILVGLELDEKYGSGNGKWNGNQLFVCRWDHAYFVGLEAVMLEEDFDLGNSKKRTKSEIQDKQPRAASSDIHQLKDENKRLKDERTKWEKKIKGLSAQQENLEKKLQDVQREKDKLMVQNNRLQTDIRAKESRIYELETFAQQAEDQVQQLETTLATAQRSLEEYQQKESCDWIVCRDEVQMTSKCLGVGGWGKVVLGTFRGCKVAVKEIHELILSPHSRRLFEREMNIASRCRHPCLLQFIGATNDDGTLLFISELLDTSLRALLGQRQLADSEISIISLDVSLALNYLHNMKSPIIHRDVSSANVLLWRRGDQWRGKVSDYGTANFVRENMTRAPGAPIYSAPEAVSPNQTSKVDVYSFGVLLCEMCIRDMPDPKIRKQQVSLMRNGVFKNLVCECLIDDPAERPDMARIIQKFEGCDQAC